MATNAELQGFVREALGRGLNRTQVERALAQAGWDGDQIRGALAGFAEVEFPVPVPRPAPYLSARDAFMYVVLFSTLYISAFNLGTLLFDLIDRLFPDPAWRNQDYYLRESIRWSISSLIVAFPIFFSVARVVNRSIRTDSRKRSSKVRYQLTYVTLFIAGSCLLGDVTALVYHLLGGALTIRFVLKVLTIALITAPVFVYYLADLRRDEENTGGRS
jgi:Domain of unknown function (DUF5671)